jgi:transketolase
MPAICATAGKGRDLEALARLIRYWILVSTTTAGSGHPTSSLSAVELMTALFFGCHFRFDPSDPKHPNNDRLIFSKGHASPLMYALWAAAGAVPAEELLTLRKFGSPLEGHPTSRFPLAEAATGSLGQGLAIGVGMALNAKYVDKLPYRTFVLLGDSEMSEGSQWEAMLLAAHYKLDNLVGIIDVNRLGQRGETMFGHDLAAYEERVRAFGWVTLTVDGHSLPEVQTAYARAATSRDQPVMIIAGTVKGKGVPFIEDVNGWHGKPLSPEELQKALEILGPVDETLRGAFMPPEDRRPAAAVPGPVPPPAYTLGEKVATRKAYGRALARIYPAHPDMVVLDGEVGNSTYAEIFKEAWPERFFEMYIAEQNMAGAALGMSLRGRKPFVSTFAAFLTRAADQIRMSQYSDADMVFCGSHCGVSIGEDGPSQMGLEDLAQFRAVHDSVVLYPADAVSAERLVEAAAARRGLTYIRTTRMAAPVIYGPKEEFPVGGCKVLRRSEGDQALIVAAGVTLHQALAAADALAAEGLRVRVIDLYSVKPLDADTLREAAGETGRVVVAEDHYPEGGLGEAVAGVLAGLPLAFRSLAVRRRPMSGKPEELLDYEGISAAAIATAVRELLGKERQGREGGR